MNLKTVDCVPPVMVGRLTGHTSELVVDLQMCTAATGASTHLTQSRQVLANDWGIGLLL
jgi:hypothetical protein